MSWAAHTLGLGDVDFDLGTTVYWHRCEFTLPAHDLPFMPQKTHVGDNRSQGIVDISSTPHGREEISEADPQRFGPTGRREK